MISYFDILQAEADVLTLKAEYLLQHGWRTRDPYNNQHRRQWIKAIDDKLYTKALDDAVQRQEILNIKEELKEEVPV